MQFPMIAAGQRVTLFGENIEVMGDVHEGARLKVFGGNIIIHGSVIGKNVFIALDETITTFADQLKVTIVGSIHETTNIYSVGPVEVKSKKMIVLHPGHTIRGASHQTLELLMGDKNSYENIYLESRFLSLKVFMQEEILLL